MLTKISRRALRSRLVGLLIGVPAGTLLATVLTGQELRDSLTGAVIGGLGAIVVSALRTKTRTPTQ